MKTLKMRWLASAIVVAGTIGFFAGAAYTEDPAAGEMDVDAMMKMMTEQAKPGEHHAKLASLAGEWDVASKTWMGGPEPMESTASCKNTVILGGRYVNVEYMGDFSGTPFEGRGVMGYDNFKKHFVSTWCDTMSTGLSMETGSLSEDGKTLTLTGEWESPAGKASVRHVYDFLSADQYVLTGYTSMGGAEMKAMELTFTRKKASAAAAGGAGRGRCCPPGSKGPGY
jgi:hypothetical protein